MPRTSDGKDYTDNTRRFTLPEDEAEKTRYVWEKLKKLVAESTHITSRYRDVLMAAKADGYSPSVVRLGNRLEHMTPEKRDKWVEEISSAAKLFSYVGLSFPDDDVRNVRDDKLWRHVVAGRFLRNEKKEVAGMLKELREIAEENGVDFAALQHMLRFHKMEVEDREDMFHRIDRMGTFLKLW